MAKYEYSYQVEELDELIDKLNKGIIPTVPEEMINEARLRYKELREELFDDSDDVLSAEEVRIEQERIKKRVEENRHKAHKDNIKEIVFSEKDLEYLREDVETSIVRPYESDYNLTDEKKYGSEERAKLYEKYSKVKRIYRNPVEFRDACKVVKDVIKDSLDHDYPGMSKAEVYELFRQGRIRVMIPVPRLFSDYVHEIKDPDVKAGVVNGDITIVSKADLDEELVVDHRTNDHEVSDEEFNIVSRTEYRNMMTDHRKGNSTPLSMIFNNRNKVYNQLSVPASNMFSRIIGDDKKEDDKPFTFDFFQEDAPRKWFNLRHNIDPSDPNTLAQIINAAYDNKLPLEVRNAIVSGSRVYIDKKYTTEKPVFEDDTFIHPKDDNVVELERAILNAIQSSN